MTPLNAAVTDAIVRAEAADHEVARLWDEVERCELALVQALEPGSLEFEIAVRGARLASEKAAARREHR